MEHEQCQFMLSNGTQCPRESEFTYWEEKKPYSPVSSCREHLGEVCGYLDGDGNPTVKHVWPNSALPKVKIVNPAG